MKSKATLLEVPNSLKRLPFAKIKYRKRSLSAVNSKKLEEAIEKYSSNFQSKKIKNNPPSPKPQKRPLCVQLNVSKGEDHIIKIDTSASPIAGQSEIRWQWLSTEVQSTTQKYLIYTAGNSISFKIPLYMVAMIT